MKNYRLLFILVLIVPLFASAESYEKNNQENTGISCLQNSFTSEIGVREATGHNDGIAVEKYLASTNLSKGYAWCAAFVNWNLEKCGFETPKSAAWSPSWFPPSKVIYHKGKITATNTNYQQPHTGDVFGIYFTNKKRVAHVGFIDSWPNKKYFISVEGNTNSAGSREGDGVYKKYRLKSQLYQVSRWT